MITSGVSFDATTHTLARNYARNQQRVGVAVEQLSTGKRINRPSDDPAGFVAAEKIRGELRELQSEGRTETYRRVSFVREQAGQATAKAIAQAPPIAVASAEVPINVDPNPPPRYSGEGDLNHPVELPSGMQLASAAPLAPTTRIDEVFTQLREDKEIILTDALSQIEDTDFAVATAELAQGQVLTEAAIVALAYATQQLTDQLGELMETIDLVVE